MVAGRGLYGEGKGVIPLRKGKKGGNMDPRGTKGAMTKIRIIDMSAWTDEDRANNRAFDPAADHGPVRKDLTKHIKGGMAS